jgi:hypothetical protein
LVERQGTEGGRPFANGFLEVPKPAKDPAAVFRLTEGADLMTRCRIERRLTDRLHTGGFRWPHQHSRTARRLNTTQVGRSGRIFSSIPPSVIKVTLPTSGERECSTAIPGRPKWFNGQGL